jgi:ATP-dependent RNA helicase DeaD
VIVPTRELARQVEQELTWLYAAQGARITSVAGGAVYRDERRALTKGPVVVVGSPGRLLDHVDRGAIDLSGVGAVVLDEADSILDLGFREDLEAILARTPTTRATHLVSATFAASVRAFADKVQKDPATVEGTQLGAANTDIEHVLHLVDPGERVDALVNLMLGFPDEQMLVFARTRADVAKVAGELKEAGFVVASLSGDMEQPERNRALAAFRNGKVRALVATDVAARGIDVKDIARVVHLEPPGDAESYTHRSGRTGRAGRKGTSSTFVGSGDLGKTLRLLRRAGVSHRLEPLPSADELRRRDDDRFLAELTSDDVDDRVDERTSLLALRLAQGREPARTIARLLLRSRQSAGPLPRVVRVVAPPAMPSAGPRTAAAPGPQAALAGGWVTFRVSWGAVHGADARRLLASVCRRGKIGAGDVGSIRIGPTSSVVEVSASVASSFASEAAKPDSRDRRVHIRPAGEERHGDAAASQRRRGPKRFKGR